MSGAFRSRRVNNSSVNYPTAIKFLSSTPITLEDTEREITHFIDQTEKWKNALPGAQLHGEDLGVGFSPLGDNSTVLSQLGRIQRDLRGLPPVVSVEPQSSNKRIKFGADDVENGARQNKKIKFDDDEESTTVNEGTKTTEDSDGIEEPKQEETQVDTPMDGNEDDQEDQDDDDDDGKKLKKSVEKDKKAKLKHEKEEKKDKEKKKDKEEKKEKKEKKDKKHKKDKKKDSS